MSFRNFSLLSRTEENEEALKRLLLQQSISETSSNSDSPANILKEKEIDDILSQIGTDAFHSILKSGDDVLGTIIAQKSAWDTEHFGFGVSKIKHMVVSNLMEEQDALAARHGLIKNCMAWMKHNNVKCAITRVGLDDGYSITAYEQNGFQLADVLVTLHVNANSKNLPIWEPLTTSVTIRPSRPGDEITLKKSARTAFVNDHFHRDARFPRNKSNELFAKWVYNSCHGFADIVLVASKKNGDLCGFITCNIEQLRRGQKYGVIDLLAVSPQHQGKGIGTQLVRESIRWFSQHVDSVFVGTQANNSVSIRTYEKIGFKPLRTELTFHHWFDHVPVSRSETEA